MKSAEEEVVDLGAVSVATRGTAPVGPIEAQTGTYYYLGGIETED